MYVLQKSDLTEAVDRSWSLASRDRTTSTDLLFDFFTFSNNISNSISTHIERDYYQSVFGYRQYHVLGIKIVLCEPLASIIHYFLFPIHDTADTQRHEGNNLFII